MECARQFARVFSFFSIYFSFSDCSVAKRTFNIFYMCINPLMLCMTMILTAFSSLEISFHLFFPWICFHRTHSQLLCSDARHDTTLGIVNAFMWRTYQHMFNDLYGLVLLLLCKYTETIENCVVRLKRDGKVLINLSEARNAICSRHNSCLSPYLLPFSVPLTFSPVFLSLFLIFTGKTLQFVCFRLNFAVCRAFHSFPPPPKYRYRRDKEMVSKVLRARENQILYIHIDWTL